MTAIAGSRPKFILIISLNKAPVTNPSDMWFSIFAIVSNFSSSHILRIVTMTDNRAAVTCRTEIRVNIFRQAFKILQANILE